MGLKDYIGIPYGYRTEDGLDCYQLAIAVLRDVYGVDAPDYEFNGTEDEAWIAFASYKLTWDTGDGTPGDLALFRIGRYQHCGVCIGNNQMIHTLRKHELSLIHI